MTTRVVQAMRDWSSALRILLATGLLLLLTLVGCGDDNGAKKDSEPAPLYGPQEAGVDGPVQDAGPCTPVALYGPPPCTSDADCVSWMGQGWYCDTTNTFDNGCGQQSPWAMCVQSAVDAGPARDGCVPVALYGPQPCGSDSDCVTKYGAGWYCDQNNVFGDGCGGTVTWPMCRQDTTPDAGVSAPDGCMPVALYGPPPCSSDADCVNWYGAGYTCDTTNTYPNGCGGTSTWPVCEKKP